MLSTPRLLLRPFTKLDAPFLLELLNTPDWLAYIGDRGVHTPEDAEHYIESRILPGYERPGCGARLIVRREDGVAMGSIGFYERPGLEVPDLGFALLPAFYRQGYAYEASVAMLAAGRRQWGITQPLAICLPGNVASIALLRKLDFVQTGRLILPDDTEELLVFTHQPAMVPG